MMGHREHLKGGWEWDAFTSWRYVTKLDRAWIKRAFRRRVRRAARARLAKQEIKAEVTDG